MEDSQFMAEKLMESIRDGLSLSPQEERVVALSMSGLGDKEVAREIGIAFETVRTYWSRVRTKVGGRTRAEIVARLLERGATHTIERNALENHRLLFEVAQRREAELRFRAIAGDAPLAIVVADKSGGCVYTNDEWQRLTGMVAPYALGEGWLEAIPPIDRERFEARWVRCAECGETLDMETRFVDRDGRIGWCRVMAADMRIDGASIGLVATVENVTDRKASVQRLQRSHDFIETVLRSMGSLVLVLDADGRVVRFNRACEIATGYREAEVAGKRFMELMARPERRADLGTQFARILEGVHHATQEEPLVCRDGTEKIVSWSVATLPDETGAVDFVVATGLDVTVQRRLENDLRAERERFRSFMDHLPAAAFVKDAEGDVTYANSMAARTLERMADTNVGRHGDFAPPGHAAWARIGRDGDGSSPQAIETILMPDGEHRFVTHRFRFQDPRGGDHLGGLLLDVTPLWAAEQKFRAAAETSFDAVMILQPQRDDAGAIEDFVFEFVNARAELYLGRPRESIVGRGLVESFGTATSYAMRDRLLQMRSSDEPFEQEFVSDFEGLQGRWVRYQAHRAGELIVLTCRDVHDAKVGQLALAEREARLNRAESLARIGSYEADALAGTVVWSPLLYDLLEVSPEEIPKGTDALRSMVHPDDLPYLDGEWEEALAQGRSISVYCRMTTASGRILDVHHLADVERDASGRTIKTIGTLRDVTEETRYRRKLAEQVCLLDNARQELETQGEALRKANARLEELAATDGLTGLRNHRAFQERLRKDFLTLRRHGQTLAVVLCDIDRFKRSNDEHGHPAGDRVLKRVSGILTASVRAGDFVARYGGEEFAVVLPMTDAEGARAVAEKMRQAIEEEPWTGRSITASFGFAVLNADCSSTAELIRRADAALYAAKESGRNAVVGA